MKKQAEYLIYQTHKHLLGLRDLKGHRSWLPGDLLDRDLLGSTARARLWFSLCGSELPPPQRLGRDDWDLFKLAQEPAGWRKACLRVLCLVPGFSQDCFFQECSLTSITGASPGAGHQLPLILPWLLYHGWLTPCKDGADRICLSTRFTASSLLRRCLRLLCPAPSSPASRQLGSLSDFLSVAFMGK